MQYFQTPDMKALGLPSAPQSGSATCFIFPAPSATCPGPFVWRTAAWRGQARQAMENIGAVLRFCGLDFADVVKCTVMLADMSEWSEFNAVYAAYFTRTACRRVRRSAATGLLSGRGSNWSASPATSEQGAGEVPPSLRSRSIFFAASSRASAIAWTCSGVAERERRRRRVRAKVHRGADDRPDAAAPERFLALAEAGEDGVDLGLAVGELLLAFRRDPHSACGPARPGSRWRSPSPRAG